MSTPSPILKRIESLRREQSWGHTFSYAKNTLNGRKPHKASEVRPAIVAELSRRQGLVKEMQEYLTQAETALSSLGDDFPN